MTSPTDEDQEQQKDSIHPLLYLWRVWKRLSDWFDIYEWFKLILGFSQTNAGAAVGAIAVVATTIVTTVAIINPEILGIRHISQPRQQVKTDLKQKKTVEIKRWNSNSIVFPVAGKDRSNRSANFEIVILNKNFRWLRGSSNQLMYRGITLSQSELNTRVFDAGLRAGLATAKALIAVGTASQEGNIISETERARRRAQTSYGWLIDVLREKNALMPVWTLTLGQYRADCEAQQSSSDSSWQRPFMVIAIRQSDKGVKLTEALADAMSNKTNIPSRSCYSNFELEQHG